MNFEEYLESQLHWSRETFGPDAGRWVGVLDHIKKELKEIEEDPSDLSEWINLIILAIDGAWRATGATPKDITECLRSKLLTNIARKWPDWKTVPSNTAIEHIKN